MEKEIKFVKWQNEKENHSHGLHVKLPAGIMTLAMLATLSPLHKARAEKPDYTPSHPIRQGGRLQPTTQEPQPTLVIPQKEQTQITTQESTESYHIEETDPFSQEGKLENFVAGYALMSKEEKKEIEKQVITDQSGATIFFSKRTVDRINPPASSLLGMRDQAFTPIALTTYDQERNPLESYIQTLYLLSDLSLAEESFVVVDDDGKNQNMIIWHGIRGGWNDNVSYLFYQNGQRVIIQVPLSDSYSTHYSTGSALYPFYNQPMWESTHNQLVYADKIRIIGDFNLNQDQEKIKSDSRIIRPTPRAMPTLLGNVHTRIRENLKRYLWYQPESFRDVEEVQRYIATGDATTLKYLKLLPSAEYPAFFASYISDRPSGEFSSLNSIQALKVTTQLLYDNDPELITILNQLGVFRLVSIGNTSTASPTIPLNDKMLQHYPLPHQSEKYFSGNRTLKNLPYSIISILFSEGYKHQFFNKVRMQQKEGGQNLNLELAYHDAGMHMQNIAESRKGRIDEGLYKSLMDTAQTNINWRDPRPQ